MDKHHHHGPLEEQQNLASDSYGLRNPGSLQTSRQMAFKCGFVLSGHSSRRMARQVRELYGEPGETRSSPFLGF